MMKLLLAHINAVFGSKLFHEIFLLLDATCYCSLDPWNWPDRMRRLDATMSIPTNDVVKVGVGE